MAFSPAVWFAVREELCGEDSMALSPKNPFDCFDDEELFCRFRLSRPCINFIKDYISVHMEKTPQTRINGHSAGAMVMAALDYYSNGVVSTTVQEKTGLKTLEAAEAVSIVSKVLSGAMNDFVTFPKTRDARANVANDIKNFCGIPDVLGVVACLHVQVRPAPEDRDAFRNTLEYFSVMTQVVCDCEGNFLSVEDCRVGSTPEQSIWESSAIGEQFIQGAHWSNWVIGGSGYSLSLCLLAAVSLVSTEPERRFNAAHTKALRAMQETLTSLKRHFRSLTNLGYCQQDTVSLEKKADVINACCVLHNVSRKFPSTLAPHAGRLYIRLEPLHPWALRGMAPARVPYRAGKARDELIAASFAFPSCDLCCDPYPPTLLPSETTLSPLDLVWAKSRGFPSYPAMVIDPDMPRKGLVHHGLPIPAPPAQVLRLGEWRRFLVLFFDRKRTWQWLQRDKLVRLGVDDTVDKLRLMEAKKFSVRKKVQTAYDLAMVHLSQHTGQDQRSSQPALSASTQDSAADSSPP